MIQSDIQFLENQDLRISQMVRAEGTDEAIAREFGKYLVKARVMPSFLPDEIRKAGDDLRPYFLTWCFMVSLPPAKSEAIWDIITAKPEADKE